MFVSIGSRKWKITTRNLIRDNWYYPFFHFFIILTWMPKYWFHEIFYKLLTQLVLYTRSILDCSCNTYLFIVITANYLGSCKNLIPSCKDQNLYNNCNDMVINQPNIVTKLKKITSFSTYFASIIRFSLILLNNTMLPTYTLLAKFLQEKKENSNLKPRISAFFMSNCRKIV